MTLEQFAKQVAGHIKGWQFKEMRNPRTALLISYDKDVKGMGIYLRSDTYDFDVETSRIEILGKYPTHAGYTYLYGEAQPRPTAAARRGPEAVARDIKRKFLVPYFELYWKGKAAMDRHKAQEVQQQKTIQELAQVLGVEAGRERLYPDYEGHGYVQVGAGGYVEFHLRSVPHDLAVSIAKLIKEHKND